MPIKFTERMIAAAIAGFEAQKREIDAEIAALRGEARESGPAMSKAPTETTKPARRKMSAATRKKMALAQKKRWAGKTATPAHKTAVEGPSAAKPKRKLSAAGKKRIIEASKRYWAEKRAAAKKAS
jgi:hypothetical protein